MVTIIIPIFNKENYIHKCINSILDQSYQNFEVILIDDGSTDNSKGVIYSLTSGDLRFNYYYQTNKGVSVARNYGILQAKGEFICFLDADDEYDKFFIEKMLLNINTADAVCCAHKIAQDNKPIRANFEFSDKEMLCSYLENRCTPNTNSWLIRKDFLIKNNIKFYLGVSWGEDMMFFSNILIISSRINFCKEYLTVYNMNVIDSLSGNSLNKITEDIFWMNIVKDMIYNSNLVQAYKNKCIEAVDGYRLPASIIYRLSKSINILSKVEYVEIYEEYEIYINKIKFINGLRSLKLYIYYYLIFFRYIVIKISLKFNF